MSSPNHSLVLSTQAQADYEDILAQTLRTWGVRQHATYAALLDQALRSLQDNPHLGHRHRDLPERYRCLHVGRHLIVYRFTAGTVYVVRVLHDRMDIPRRAADSLDDDRSC